ncbi:MAG: DUF4024 domain-containing protein [Bacteroidales bacterium]|nr:DUF4024 domain-containing protein [Bacteroidales bacterium]
MLTLFGLLQTLIHLFSTECIKMVFCIEIHFMQKNFLTVM